MNRLIYMDDINVFAKNEKELESIMQAVKMYCEDIGRESRLEKGTMLIMRCGKR